jgi:hypothetical protein
LTSSVSGFSTASAFTHSPHARDRDKPSMVTFPEAKTATLSPRGTVALKCPVPLVWTTLPFLGRSASVSVSQARSRAWASS